MINNPEKYMATGLPEIFFDQFLNLKHCEYISERLPLELRWDVLVWIARNLTLEIKWKNTNTVIIRTITMIAITILMILKITITIMMKLIIL